MDAEKVDQILMAYSSKFPAESVNILRDRLLACENEGMVHVIMAQLKDPTIALVLSICLGYFGVDRFYIGDPGLGVAKLLTCGGLYIWAIVDIFMIMDATKRKNMEILMMQL
ncbi:MAG: TM2 domain-containing protein [Paludibacteraceae bacterium]|nr:TM2 domain-containing protein [Paludibacteraceae bacterium]